MIDILGVAVNVVNLTGWGAFTFSLWLFARALITGKLRTEREVLEIRQDRDQRLIEVGAWKTAWSERGQVVNELMAQNRKLLELSETSAHVLKSLPTPGETEEVSSG